MSLVSEPDLYGTAVIIEGFPTVVFPPRSYSRVVTKVVVGNPAASNVKCLVGSLTSFPVASNPLGSDNTLSMRIAWPAGQPMYVRWSGIPADLNLVFARMTVFRDSGGGGNFLGDSIGTGSWSNNTSSINDLVRPSDADGAYNVAGELMKQEVPDGIANTLFATAADIWRPSNLGISAGQPGAWFEALVDGPTPGIYAGILESDNDLINFVHPIESKLWTVNGTNLTYVYDKDPALDSTFAFPTNITRYDIFDAMALAGDILFSVQGTLNTSGPTIDAEVHALLETLEMIYSDDGAGTTSAEFNVGSFTLYTLNYQDPTFFENYFQTVGDWFADFYFDGLDTYTTIGLYPTWYTYKQGSLGYTEVRYQGQPIHFEHHHGQGPFSADSTVSAVYVDLLTDFDSWSLPYPGGTLRIDVHASMSTDTANTKVGLGLRIKDSLGSTTAEVDLTEFMISLANNRVTVSATYTYPSTIADPIGSVDLLWKVVSGAGTLAVDADDYYTYNIQWLRPEGM